MKIRYLAVPFIFISSQVFAWICPNNFNQIVAGDSIEQVNIQCGKPASETQTEKTPSVPQEWTYYVTLNQSQYQTPGAAMAQSSAGASVKMTIAFVKDKAVNISTQAMSLSSTSICGATISVGDSTKSIEAACGKPSFIQKQEAENAKPLEIIEYKYNTAPPNTLIFENGKLKERK